jgi:hypothetical protein
VTHRPIRVEADGTRVYAEGKRYRPVAPEQRKNRVLKPDHPDAVRFHGNWFLPLELAPDEARDMPATRPDEETLEHRAWCRCEVCTRPAAAELWRRARRGS